MNLLNKLVISVLLMMLFYQLAIEIKYFLLQTANNVSILITKIKLKKQLARRNKALNKIKQIERKL